MKVLNLVISGIPSIQEKMTMLEKWTESFKPCYKWNTFNTSASTKVEAEKIAVLNLVISGIPSILASWAIPPTTPNDVLNLVISGIPSIP